MKKLYGIAALASVLLASGCAVQEPDVSVFSQSLADETWSHEPQGAVAVWPESVEFWGAFGDGVLTTLVSKACESSSDVKAAVAGVRAARALVTGTTAALWPTGTVSVGGQQTDVRHDGDRIWSAGGQLQYSLNLAGREYRLDEAAQLDAAASLLTLEDVRAVVAADTAQSYFNYRWARLQTALLQEAASNYRETADLAGWRYEAGLGSASDAEDALTQWSNARAQLADAQRNAQTYVNALARLTLMKRSAVQALLDSGEQALPALPSAVVASVPADALRRRPDVRSAELSLRAAAYRIAASKAAFFPSLTLTGDLGLQTAGLSALGGASAVASIAGTLGATIMNWGALQSQSEQQKAEFDRLEADYTAIVSKALEAADNAATALRQAEEKKTWLENATRHAAAAAQLSGLEYETGNGDYQQLLSTQRTLLSTRQSALQNQVDALNACVVLYRALGGGWTTATQATLDDKEGN